MDAVARGLAAKALTPKTLSRPPVSTDDTSRGYKVGDMVFDTSRNMSWRAAAVTAGAALWVPERRNPYVPVSNRVAIPSFLAGSTNAAAMTRRQHKSGPVQVIRPRLRYYNGYVSVGGVETPNANPLVVTAALEVPGGTFYQAKKDGSASLTIAAGEVGEFDPLAPSIPAGTTFYERSSGAVSGGNYTAGPFSNLAADGYENGATVTDKTMSGTVGKTGTNTVFCAAAIVGESPGLWQPSYILIGDSILAGWKAGAPTYETGDADGNYGWGERLIGPSYAYLNLSRGGTQANQFSAAGAIQKRLALMSGVGSHVLWGLGRNDYAGSRTAAQIKADTESAIAVLNSLNYKVFVATLAPTTTSTDSWVTTGNQTIANAGQETERLAYNTAVRAGQIAGACGYLDLADALETARNSGIWKANYTGDGIHPNETASAAAAAALSINSVL